MSRIDDIDCGTPRGIQDIPCRQTSDGGGNNGNNGNAEHSGIRATVSMGNPSSSKGMVEHIITVEAINHTVEGDIYLYFRPSPDNGYPNIEASYTEDGQYLWIIDDINSEATTITYTDKSTSVMTLEIKVLDSEGNEIHNTDSILKGEYNEQT